MTQAQAPTGPFGEPPAQYYHLYKAAFDSSSQGICVFDVVLDEAGHCHDMVYLAANSAFDQHSPLRNVVGKNLRSLLPDVEQYWLDLYARVAATGQSESYENVRGADRWSRVHASRVGGAGSRTVLAAFEDVTERKHAELALQASARRQAFLLKLADGLKAIADPVAVQETASRLMGEYLNADRVGYAEIEGVGDDAMIVLQRDWCRAGTRSVVGRYRLETFGNFVLETSLAGRPVVIDDVSTDGRLTASDIANWTSMGIGAAMAHSLVKEGRFLAYLFVHSGRARHWTEEDIVLLGDVAERTWAAVERARAQDALRKSHEMLEARVLERTQQAAAARDDAERNAALKSRFLAATAHDLRQPLQAALSYLAVLRRKVADPDVESLCDRSKVQLQAMADILDTLLDLSRLEGGAITPQLCDFDVDELVDAVVATYQPMALAKGLKLDQVKGNLTGRSDPALLDRILANLVSNAIRYTSEGTITVRSERHAGTIEIEVNDTGIGISTEASARIFEPFVQLNNPARDRSKGLGLGLSIVRAIAQGLGHRIEVSSELGRGSTFRIFIPEAGQATEASPPAEEAEMPQDAVAARDKLAVLIIDDDPAVLESTAMLLRLENCEVAAAGTCKAAISLIDQGFSPAVIVSDLRLPDGDGRDLILTLRTHAGREIPAILLTGEIQPGKTRPGDQTYEILYKPVDFDRLMAMITKASTEARG
jgi:signal transduction histidine kinase/ActR/RegA family two-component response regulator